MLDYNDFKSHSLTKKISMKSSKCVALTSFTAYKAWDHNERKEGTARVKKQSVSEASRAGDWEMERGATEAAKLVRTLGPKYIRKSMGLSLRVVHSQNISRRDSNSQSDLGLMDWPN